MESPQEETTSVHQIALNNPIILTEILKKSSTPLKTCRLVCKFWNEMVLSLQNPRLALNLAKQDDDFTCDPVPFFALCYKMDDRLAKWVSTWSDLPEDEMEISGASQAKLMHLCDKFGDLVEILDVIIHDEEDYLNSIHLILQNCCPNLKRLRISSPFTNLYYHNYKKILEGLPPKEVVNAAPNLAEVTIPWKVFPDLANSKRIHSLTIALDGVRPDDIFQADDKLSQLEKILAQVGDQLVTLRFGSVTDKAVIPTGFNSFKYSGFNLPKKMSKLQYFRNHMVDIFECGDFLQNTKSLKTLVLGKAFTWLKSLDEILKNIFAKKKIFGNGTSLTLREIHDLRLFDGLKAAFPNLERLALDTYGETDWRGRVSEMELDVVLRACVGWKSLKHLDLALPTFPEEIAYVIHDLLYAGDLYKRLKTLQIMGHREILRCTLTDEELEKFKQVIVALDAVEDKVIIDNFSFGQESVSNIKDFIRANKMNLPKFAIFLGGSLS
ncbi:uncharacterized protein LOC118439215 isoform X1 [Folsomia candida]|uniref:uncharacterized protein LOC118439215 isoform X1 n=1 Tax=Folsomia candida TaxID=158441 RepID=UPI001604FE69|nr:uncharacterized protein LOC118439215 isoform X1 [Folsomia candida]